MIDDIIADADERMQKSIASREEAFKKSRNGRAHPGSLDSVRVAYYGADTPLNQLANVTVEEGRSLIVSPWEKPMIGEIEKAIMKSDLGLNPVTAGTTIRIPLPPLTEERRVSLGKVVHHEGENAKIAIRNIRRDANHHLKELLKSKDISEDDDHRAEQNIQQITDKQVTQVDEIVAVKEQEMTGVSTPPHEDFPSK